MGKIFIAPVHPGRHQPRNPKLYSDAYTIRDKNTDKWYVFPIIPDITQQGREFTINKSSNWNEVPIARQKAKPVQYTGGNPFTISNMEFDLDWSDYNVQEMKDFWDQIKDLGTLTSHHLVLYMSASEKYEVVCEKVTISIKARHSWSNAPIRATVRFELKQG